MPLSCLYRLIFGGAAAFNEIEIIAMWCHGERFENMKENPVDWSRFTCAEDRYRQRRSRKSKKGKNIIPYYDVKIGPKLLRHVMLAIKKRRCNRCEEWCESESFGAF